MNKLIEEAHEDAELLEALGTFSGEMPVRVRARARRLEECRALLQRLANDEPAPEGHSYQSWAKELLQ